MKLIKYVKVYGKNIELMDDTEEVIMNMLKDIRIRQKKIIENMHSNAQIIDLVTKNGFSVNYKLSNGEISYVKYSVE